MSPTPRRLLRWRSPLRGAWLTSVLGAVLLVGMPVVILTGLLSYIAYGPQFGQAIPADVGWLKLPTFDWPADPAWLYRLTQGLHVGLGLVLVPVVLAKLWSVIPRLFQVPPARSIAQLVERVSLLMLVGGVLFEIVTGVLNIQYDYIFGFSFYTAHYFGAWVFIAGFVMHIAVKIPRMRAGLRSRSMREVLRTRTADTVAEPFEPDGLAAADPDPATISRRGALALVGGGAALVAVLTAGQTLGGWTRHAALLLPRGRTLGDGPNDFQVNRTAAAARITPDLTGDRWRLTLTGGSSPVVLDRAALTAMPQHTAHLPIACVEGWSTTETWTGVPLRDLARLAGVPDPASAFVQSVERRGAFNRATLQRNQVLHPDALLALRVNGADLSPDHGFPARIIVPALPGVHNTKWVGRIDFRAGG
ncbi:Oxidoreductase molybdopterin binding domain-containing protein [Mycolicibacterium rutilum]|uniref:Oxidoreductase molybdopterin binding domain-containing protein n=1 Tax=Mycolicibacterium rutilum TaxID=370526 RepID=A0A1H6IHW9_MYCRU|nr:molybdopterin-dependent oxidoreductase [Mycolicibacterium rutilum]SEH48995.1 Oxidoreductase molybdopterin binding domain-containing protein [Mycolicibacterium rutilum]